MKTTSETTPKPTTVVNKTSILNKAEEIKKITNKPTTHKSNNESVDSLNSSKEKSDEHKSKSPKTPVKNQQSSEHVIFI